MHRKMLSTLAAAFVALLSLGHASAVEPADGPTIPKGFHHWYLVNSMIVTKDSPIFSELGGLHQIFINSTGFPRLTKGGPAPYPDGTIFTDDVREFSVVDGSYTQGARKAIAVMVKDAKKYESTGGWGFQVFAGGDPKKPLAVDPVKMCFACHTPQKANDYVFSTYLH